MHRQCQYWNLIDVSWQWDKANACLGVVRVGRDSIAWSQVAHHTMTIIIRLLTKKNRVKQELAI